MTVKQSIERPPCRCCNRRGANRPLGLCWACYHRPGVREEFPSTSVFASGRSVPDFDGPDAHLPLPEPTDALPGTPEKVAVLEERALRRFRLWHPEDATRFAHDD